jgi:hypothetical protein
VAPLTSAAIEGVTDATGTVTTGTVWDTTVNGFYLAVLQQPLGTILNGNDPASISIPSVLGKNDFAVSGDGWPIGEVNNSDLFYRLTLGFGDGTVVSGVYDTVSNNFFGSTSGNITLDGFLWERQEFNIVSEYSSTKGGSPADYNGGFSYTAVPEPATWAMMIGGFGMVGAAMRRRKAQVRVTYA